MSYGQIGLELVKAIVTALLAAVLVHLLEHRRFIQGRWWDRKADAYDEVVGVLDDLVRLLAKSAFLVRERREVEGTTVDSVVEEIAKVGDRLLRAATLRDYVISRKASDALRDLVMKFPLREEDPSELERWVPVLKELERVASSCLGIVSNEAKSDLRVRWWSL
jgi:predicted kinase